MSCLHGVAPDGEWFSKADFDGLEIFVRGEESFMNNFGENNFAEFAEAAENDSLEEAMTKISIIEDSLIARAQYLENTSAAQIAIDCSDPEFSSYTLPLVDCCFFSVPAFVKEAVDAGKLHAFSLSTVTPLQNDPFYLVTWQNVAEPVDDALIGETFRTVEKTAALYVAPGRSVALGSFGPVGTMASLNVNTTFGTSGSPVISGNGSVTAMNIGSYYDRPLSEADVKKFIAADEATPLPPTKKQKTTIASTASGGSSASESSTSSTATSMTGPTGQSTERYQSAPLAATGKDRLAQCGRNIVEPAAAAASKASRNANIAISVGHPAVQNMIAATIKHLQKEALIGS